jgi:predicted RNA-binding Zn ribbon-like protein
VASTSDPSSSTALAARDPAPGRLELVRQFINTADVETGEDDLVDVAALRSWLRERELIGRGELLEEGDVERARAVREALRDLLEDRSHGVVAQAALHTLNGAGAAASLRVCFERDGAPTLEPLVGGMDRAFAELFAIIERASLDGTWARMKVCAGEACRWAFYDHSKNRSGAWCSMSVCGNRAKARSYRRRRRSGDAPA